MMEKLTAKIKFSLLLGLGAILVLFLSVQSRAAESPLTCPLEREVPIGQLINQTTQTVDKVLRAALNSLAASRKVVTAGGKVYDLTDQTCQKDRCQPDCQKKLRAKFGTPITSCTPGHTCDYQNRIVNGSDLMDELDSIEAIDCTKLGEMNPYFEIDSEHFYGAFDWASDGVDPCDSDPYCGLSHSCSFEIKKTGDQLCSLPAGCEWQMCGDPMTSRWIYPPDPSEYNVYDVSPDGVHCLVACGATAIDSGSCFVDWTEEYCQVNSCSGQACDFTQLNQQKTIITTETAKVINANSIIKKVFNDKIANLPLLGDVCKIPFFGSISCNLCGVLNLSSCKTEIDTILLFFEKAMANDQWCYNAPEDYAKIITGEKEGKFLLNCESLTPTVLEQCYPNNFYCCY